MATAEQRDLAVREVTDDEVETIFEKGWVILRGLISPQDAAQLLEHAKGILGEQADEHKTRMGIDDYSPTRAIGDHTSVRPFRSNFRFASREDATLRSLARHEQMGRNAARLLGRDSSIRSLVDSLGARLPWPSEQEPPELTFHQAQFGRPMDRRSIGFWVAMDDVTPEMGSLEIYSGSHRMGPLGLGPLSQERLASWRYFDRWPREKPGALRAGDAIAHLSQVVQTSVTNMGEAIRWAYVLGYMPADARYMNFPSPYTDGLGMAQWDLFDHPNFPIVYTGSAPEIPLSGHLVRQRGGEYTAPTVLPTAKSSS